MTIEHKKARMDGGSDDLSNLAAACFHCNQHRGRQMNEARQRAHQLKVSSPVGSTAPLPLAVPKSAQSGDPLR